MARYDEEKAPPLKKRASALHGALGQRTNDALEGEEILDEALLVAGNGITVTPTRVILIKAGMLMGNTTRIIPISEIQKMKVVSLYSGLFLEFHTSEPITAQNKLSWEIQSSPHTKAHQDRIVALIQGYIDERIVRL